MTSRWTVSIVALILSLFASTETHAGDCHAIIGDLIASTSPSKPLSAIVTVNAEGGNHVYVTPFAQLSANGSSFLETQPSIPLYGGQSGPLVAIGSASFRIFRGEAGNPNLPPLLILTIANIARYGVLGCDGNVMFGVFKTHGRAAFTISFKRT